MVYTGRLPSRFWGTVNFFLPPDFSQHDRERQRRIRVQLVMSLGMVVVYVAIASILASQVGYFTPGSVATLFFAGLYLVSLISVRKTRHGQYLLGWVMFFIPLVTYALHSWRIGGEPIPERLITFPLMMSLALGVGWGLVAVFSMAGVTYGFQIYEATWGEIPVTLVKGVETGVEQLPLIYMLTVIAIIWFLEIERHENQNRLKREYERRQEAELQKQLAEARREDELKMMEQSKLAMLGETSASIAHEINNPMAYLRGVMDLWSLRLQRGKMPEEHEFRESLQQGLQQAERISDIVHHLRSFGRSDSGGTQAYSLRQPIEGALLLLRHSLHRASIALELEIPDDLPELQGNPGRLEQVLLNLLGNARDALGESGGGAITLSAQLLKTDPPLLELQVRDNGPGIPEAIRAHIFTAFYTTKPVGQGTGLGLSICQGIVKNLGGTLTCESEVGQGTTFRIQVPLQPPAQG